MNLIFAMEETLDINSNSFNFLNKINVNNMHSKNIKGNNIKIAILDTGLDYNHDFFKDKIIKGYNFTNGDSTDYIDRKGHGTHVSGIISSVAPNAELLVIKVLDDNGYGNYDWFVNGVNYAINQGVDIISMSLGGTSNDTRLLDAINLALSKNILVVCAAGNNGDGNADSDELVFPGSYNEVIQVGAIDDNYNVTTFSNSNKNVDIVAFGKSIESTYLNNTYKKLSGTSMATPFVSGSLALIKEWSRIEFERDLTESELYAQLIKNTKLLKNVSRKQQGNGYLFFEQ